MAKFQFELPVESRHVRGKAAARRLRRLEDKVLGVVYGGNQAPELITLEHRHVIKAFENEAVYSHVLTLNNQGTQQRVVLKDLLRHAYKPRILHMDFLRVDENKEITMHVPLHFKGEDTAPGVKAGGIVTHHIIELEVRCLPKDLPEFIEIDLSQANIDTVIHLSDITLPTGVVATHHAEEDLVIASIHRPRAQEPEPEATPPAEKA